MAAVFLKLMVYNKKVIVYENFTKKAVDIVDFTAIDKLPIEYGWIPPNFIEVEDYPAFVYSLEMEEDTGEMRIN